VLLPQISVTLAHGFGGGRSISTIARYLSAQQTIRQALQRFLARGATAADGAVYTTHVPSHLSVFSFISIFSFPSVIIYFFFRFFPLTFYYF
jgi:hypothetical protein